MGLQFVKYFKLLNDIPWVINLAANILVYRMR